MKKFITSHTNLVFEVQNAFTGRQHREIGTQQRYIARLEICPFFELHLVFSFVRDWNGKRTCVTELSKQFCQMWRPCHIPNSKATCAFFLQLFFGTNVMLELFMTILFWQHCM